MDSAQKKKKVRRFKGKGAKSPRVWVARGKDIRRKEKASSPARGGKGERVLQIRGSPFINLRIARGGKENHGETGGRKTVVLASIKA